MLCWPGKASIGADKIRTIAFLFLGFAFYLSPLSASFTPAARYDALVSAEGTIASRLALGAKDRYDLLQTTLPQTYEARNIAA